jgi:hypothetical protein
MVIATKVLRVKCAGEEDKGLSEGNAAPWKITFGYKCGMHTQTLVLESSRQKLFVLFCL